mmetsp:Transcript_30788/g.66057  ORF Transcript_30788/g.66057 Transcript_30788/m.66057 type:complete len:564 (-) Transcript_30788:74-1765(-)
MSLRPSSRAEQRRKSSKKTIDANEARKKREEVSIEIRKSKREENLQKRRQFQQHMSGSAGGQGGDISQPGLGAGAQDMSSASGMGAAGNQANTIREKLELLGQMKAGVFSDVSEHQLEATVWFRKLLSIERNPPIAEVIQADVVGKFVEFLQRNDIPQLQFEAAWALTNIASGTSEHTKVVIQKGAVPIFVHLLASPSEDVREQAVWALGNIAGDSPKCRDLVLNQGAMQPLLAQLNPSAKVTMLRNATWTLSNYCRGKPQPAFEQVKPALPVLAQLVTSSDEDVLTDALWALSYLSDGTNDRIQAVIEVQVCKRLVELLVHPTAAVLIPALRTVGNIVTGNDVQTQIIINCGALGCLLQLLTNYNKKSIKKESCWTISNITAGNKEQIQAVIESGIIPPLVGLLSTAEFDIKKEAAWAISNATSGGTSQQIRFLASCNCIKPLCDLLTCSDPRIVSVAMEGLENILKVGEADKQLQGPNAFNMFAKEIDECEGVDKIENLQNHQNTDIYNKAVNIIEVYFGGDDETEDQNLAPSVDPNAQMYTFSQQGMPVPQGGFNFAPPQ